MGSLADIKAIEQRMDGIKHILLFKNYQKHYVHKNKGEQHFYSDFIKIRNTLSSHLPFEHNGLFIEQKLIYLEH